MQNCSSGKKIIADFSCYLCGYKHGNFFLNSTDLTGTVPGKFYLVQCPRCKIIYLHPLPQPEQISSFYPESYYENTPYRRKKILRRAARFSQRLQQYINYKNTACFQKNVLSRVFLVIYRWFILSADEIFLTEWAPGARILDIGCGQGDFLLLANRLGWDTYGVEPNTVAVTTARMMGLKVYAGELSRVHFSDNFFQVIRLHHVLEHIYDPIAVMKEIRRIIREDGCLMITVPNIQSLGFKVFNKFWWNLDLPRHIFLYCPQTLAFLAEKTGFQLLRLVHQKAQSGLVRSVSLTISKKNKLLQKLIRRLPPVQIFCLLLNFFGQAIHRGEYITAFLAPLPSSHFRKGKSFREKEEVPCSAQSFYRDKSFT